MVKRTPEYDNSQEIEQYVNEVIAKGKKYLKEQRYEMALKCFREASGYAPLRKDVRELAAQTLDCIDESTLSEDSSLEEERTLPQENIPVFLKRNIAPFKIKKDKIKREKFIEEEEDEDSEDELEQLIEDDEEDEFLTSKQESLRISRFRERHKKKSTAKFWIFFIVFSLVLFAVVLSVLLIEMQRRGLIGKGTQEISEEQKVIEQKVNALYQEASMLGNPGSGRYAEALTKLQEALNLKPQNVKVIEDKMAQIYYDKGREEYERLKYESARESFEAAVMKNSANPEYYYSLGWAYYKLGKKSQKNSPAVSKRYLTFAEESFKKAIEIDSGFVKAYNSLGQTYISLNNQTEAINMYKKVIELAPDSDQAERARSILKEYGAR